MVYVSAIPLQAIHIVVPLWRKYTPTKQKKKKSPVGQSYALKRHPSTGMDGKEANGMNYEPKIGNRNRMANSI